MLSRSRLIAKHITCTVKTFHLTTSVAAMSSFILPNSNPECQVQLTSDLSKEQLLNFPAFRTWTTTLQHSLSTQESKSHVFYDAPYKLRKIEVQSVDFFGGGRVGFVKLKAEVSNDNGEKLPGSVFLRGGSVGILVCMLWAIGL